MSVISLAAFIRWQVGQFEVAGGVDQWELQMQSRVLARIGMERLWFVSDGIAQEMQRHIAVNPILGAGDAEARANRAIEGFLAARPDARVAVIPDGPYTMLREHLEA